MLEWFKPSSGIHQEDVICPHLFVLCVERLGHIIYIVIKPIQLSRNGLLLSHMLFVDDLVLFV